LGVTYVVACSLSGSGGGTLGARLERRDAPDWLEPLSKPAEALQVYRLR
jgi:hypothetical protein